jgi:hypothetical protein
MKRRVAFLIIPALALGCVESPDIPTLPEQVLSMQVLADQTIFTRGASVTVSVVLTNTLDELVRLTFPTSCQAQLYVRTGLGRVVTPEDGDYNCASVPTQISLQAGEAITFTFVWSGESEFGPPGSGATLPPGDYFASAELNADGYRGIAFPIKIVLN